MNADFAKALAAFQAECKPIARQSKGYNYKYADYAAIMAEVGPLLQKHGLVFVCQTVGENNTLLLRATLLHAESADSFESDIPLNHMLKPQDMGSALTYYRRYLMTAMLNVVVLGEDDDGKRATDAHQQAPDTPQSTHDSRSASWAGPLTKTELKKAVHDLSRSLEAAASLEDLSSLRNSYLMVIEQVQKDMPEWWSGMVRDGEMIPGLEQRFADVETRVNDIKQGAGVVQ